MLGVDASVNRDNSTERFILRGDLSMTWKFSQALKDYRLLESSSNGPDEAVGFWKRQLSYYRTQPSSSKVNCQIIMPAAPRGLVGCPLSAAGTLSGAKTSIFFYYSFSGTGNSLRGSSNLLSSFPCVTRTSMHRAQA